MKIKNVVHKGLRRFIENDDASGLPPDTIPKIRRMISYLQEIESEEELRVIPSWRAHTLSGEKKGTWSLSVTRNWRITFQITKDTTELVHLNFEDYH